MVGKTTNHWGKSTETPKCPTNQRLTNTEIDSEDEFYAEKVENLQNQIAGLEVQTPPHPELLSSIGFVRENPGPQFFSTLDMDDSPKIQPIGIPDPFADEIGTTFLNTQSS